MILKIVIPLISLLFGGFIGYFQTFYSLRKTNEVQVQQVLNEIKTIFIVNSLEIQGIAQLKMTDKSNHALSWLTNAFSGSEYVMTLPYKAKMGINLNDSRFILKFEKDTIYAELPESQLQSFEFDLDNRKIISSEGFFVSRKDDHFQEMEKKLYVTEKQNLSENKDFIKIANLQSEKALLKLLKPLNKPVVFNHILVSDLKLK